jgi:hypothetical protein
MKLYIIYLFWIGLAITTIGWTIAIGFYVGLDLMKDGKPISFVGYFQMTALSCLLYYYVKFYLTHDFKIKEGG